MRTVLRRFSLFGLLGLLVIPIAAVAAGPAVSHGHSRAGVAAVPGVFKSMGFVPKHRRGVRVATPVSHKEIVEGGTYYEDPETGQLTLGTGPMMDAPMMDAAGVEVADVGAMGFDGGCVDGSCGGCDSCAMGPCCVTLPRGNLQLFAGVQGYTGPANRPDGRGSFGFSEGLNWGMPIPGFGCLGGQVGFRATQSNLSGSEFTDDNRNQGFLTAGLFRRVDAGLQGGLVIDYMSESWYRDVDLTNVRGELSWVIDGVHDLGFWFTSASKDSTEFSFDNELEETWEPTDLFAFFYRYQFGDCRDGEARLFAGWSGTGDGYIGFDTLFPLSGAISLEANVAYLIPEEGKGQGFNAAHTQESWNIGLGVVWYPGRRFIGRDHYYRPLFRVADNGNFMVDRIAP